MNVKVNRAERPDKPEHLDNDFKIVTEFFNKANEERITTTARGQLRYYITKAILYYLKKLLEKHNMLAAKDRDFLSDIDFCMVNVVGKYYELDNESRDYRKRVQQRIEKQTRKRIRDEVQNQVRRQLRKVIRNLSNQELNNRVPRDSSDSSDSNSD